MQLLAFLAGSRFYKLLQHGRETEQIIARNDDSLLQHSTIELERYFDNPPAQLPRQNAFSLALALLCFLVVFVLNLLMLLHILPDQQPQVRALCFFLPSILFLISILSASYQTSRGYLRGLNLFFALHGLLFIATIAQLMLAMLAGDSRHAVMMVVALAAALLCRRLINSQSFILFVLWCRSQRIASLAREIRSENNNLR
ncbi:hypothetical protein N5923_12890 [Erwiniaceae bacterium BAC15a-03b]|uniref:Uncharacterized protein n=1 Tax=Winslowiella arboricola TaxID=2978220 RepID=A0A9J6PPT9_9GAMM|nr:hypothetical protein [Winslowiella arboricola]MCU5773714.1 hypothetical protein [Winslowiella arboricola]MCU5778387.1 hypothetical protein [Winslowiella arboricola]